MIGKGKFAVRVAIGNGNRVGWLANEDGDLLVFASPDAAMEAAYGFPMRLVTAVVPEATVWHGAGWWVASGIEHMVSEVVG